MKAETYISTAKRTDRRGKVTYRVAVKRFSGNLNSLDATFAEAMFRTESAASKFIEASKRQFGDAFGNIKVQGDLA